MERLEILKKYRYSIEIREPSRNDLERKEKYSVWFNKNYGDMYGGATGCSSLKSLKDLLRRIVRRWGEYDSIVGRMPDPVTEKTLYFESFTDEVTKSDALGIQTLRDWVR
jgi:hypothetical protein